MPTITKTTKTMKITKITKTAVLLGLLGGGLPACGGEPAHDLQVVSTFTIQPGEETYQCQRVNVTDDTYVTRIVSSEAPGVHHQILGIAIDQSKPEGAAPCESVGLGLTENWLFVASRSAQEFAMPPNVAFKVKGGTQLVLQLHLLNGSDAPLTSGVTLDLEGIAEDDVVDRAQVVAAGSVMIDVPAGQSATVTGHCALDRDVKVFGLLPHMHFMGTTFRAALGDLASGTMLFDGPFQQEAQPFVELAPTTLPAATPLTVECNYTNTTGAAIKYGSSGLDEMCFAFTYFYPAIDAQGPLCIN